MTVISESQVRAFYIKSSGEQFMLPQDAVLTPAAMDYAREHGIKISRVEAVHNGLKPHHMTHGRGGELILKNEPVIRLRGKLDSLQAIIAQIQCGAESSSRRELAQELEEALILLRSVMKAEVVSEPLHSDGIWGKNWDWYHKASHNPQASFGMNHTSVSHTMGKIAVDLNYLRTQIRETELAAVEAFCQNGAVTREDIITVLNRLSSAVYVLFLRELSRRSKKEGSYGPENDR